MRFPNLAYRGGLPDKVQLVKETTRKELTEAGVQILGISEPLAFEVPASDIGVLTSEKKYEESSTFTRYYNTESVRHWAEGGSDMFDFVFVRNWYYWSVHGNIPLRIANEMYQSEPGRKDIRSGGDAGCRPPDTWAKWDAGRWVIRHYHIDSQEGLNLFVQTVKKHGLVEGYERNLRIPPDYPDWEEFCSVVNVPGAIYASRLASEGSFLNPEVERCWNLWRRARDSA